MSMLHRICFEKNDCYFLVRPWGNLIIYNYWENSEVDNQHFFSKGGVYRQLTFNNSNICPGQSFLFHKFGAALVTPLAVEYHPNIKIEENGVDFYDPYITFIKFHELQAIRLINKNEHLYFLDENFRIEKGRIVSASSAHKDLAQQFIQSLNPARGDQFLAPLSTGQNIHKF